MLPHPRFRFCYVNTDFVMKPCCIQDCKEHTNDTSPWPQTEWIGHLGPPKKIGKTYAAFTCFRSMEKSAWNGRKWSREFVFPTNPDLADIWGDTDFCCEKLDFDYICLIFWIPHFWMSRSQTSGLSDFQKSGFPDFPKPGFPGFQKIHGGRGADWRMDGRADT